MERLKTKDLLQWVEINTTPQSPIGSISVRISPVMTPGRDHIAVMDTEQVELVATNGTQLNP